MYISNITHVNITNYLEISFQSVSDFGVGPAAAACDQSEPVATGWELVSWNESEPVGNSRNQQKKRRKKTNSRNKSESGGTSRNWSVRTFFCVFFFFWHKVLHIFWQDYNSKILIWVVNTCRYCGYQQISIDSLAVVARCGKMKLFCSTDDQQTKLGIKLLYKKKSVGEK